MVNLNCAMPISEINLFFLNYLCSKYNTKKKATYFDQMAFLIYLFYYFGAFGSLILKVVKLLFCFSVQAKGSLNSLRAIAL